MNEFNLKQEIQKLEDSKRRDLNIIAFYFNETKPDFRNKDQFNSGLKRHLRAAKSLVPFEDDQLIKAMDKAKTAYSNISWTLETLLKILTR